ncbi:hypothetical protein [Hymenobacter persicinus]|uniref:DUF3575 domain-containing protein n=1 Tax=Hymenobacter persicinus TaxID=2025506 RepID=A0A4Q5LAZ0_9BACT|nr:hypothetical protein [Hymenobacter persicinus]RYU79302.1 hypothetical protein EWM57_11200 [Hymenobacter persicinus]
MKSVFALFLASLPLAAVAQAPADSTHRHQLGLTASPQLDKFFQANRSLPLGVLYKRQITPTQALRVRLVGQYSRRDTANYPGSYPGFFPGLRDGTYTQSGGVNLYAGYEWQRAITRRWVWAYGAELGAGWSQKKEHTISDENVGTPPSFLFVRFTFTQTATIWEGQARPFISLQYRISNRIALFAESAVLLTYQSRKDEQDASGTAPYGSSYIYNKSHSLSLLWRPVQLVGATYAF